MPTAEFIQLIVVALAAGYVGFLLGRASAGAGVRNIDAPSAPLPGPVADASGSPRERRSGTLPPAGAGPATTSGTSRTPPRRSSAPPPAAAGLMDRHDE